MIERAGERRPARVSDRAVYETVTLVSEEYEALKVAVPVEVLMPLQLMFSVCLACVNVQQLLMVCGPSIVLVPARDLYVHL